MIKEDYYKEITRMMSEFKYTVQMRDSLNLYDINTIAEDFVCGILNRILGYSLVNLNNYKENYAGIDLGSKKDSVAVQVSKNSDRKKVDYTIRQFIKREYYNDYSRLIFFICGEKKQYRKEFDTKGLFEFDWKNDIIDITDICRLVKAIPERKKLQEVYEYIASETSNIARLRSIDKRVLSIEKDVKALCISSMTALGVENKCAERIIESDIGSNRFDYILLSNKQFLTGDYGTGKTYAIRSLFLQQCQAYKEKKSNIVPLYATVREVFDAGGIKLWAEEVLLEKCNTILFLDGLDELEYESIERIIEEVHYIKERFKKCTIITATRHLSCIDNEESININLLSDDAVDKLYSILIGHESTISHMIHYKSGPLHMKLLNIPLFLLLYAKYKRNDALWKSSDIDVVSFFIDDVIAKQKRKSRSVYQQLMKLAVLVVDNNMLDIHESELNFEPDWDDLMATGLVVYKENGYYDFSLPILAQWLSALAIKSGIVDLDMVVKERAAIIKWRYPLSILFGITPFDTIKNSFSTIVINYPAIAGIIIKDGIRVEKHQGEIDTNESAKKLQYCMSVWINGMGSRLSKSLDLSENGTEPNTLFFNTKKGYIEYSWSCYRLKDSVMSRDSQELRDGFHEKILFDTIKAQSTWPWITTYNVIKKRIQNRIKKRIFYTNWDQIQKEMFWKSVLEFNHKGSQYSKAFDIQSLIKACPPRDEIDKFVPQQKSYFAHLFEMADKGKTVIEPPYPVGDRITDGGWIWSEFSDEQMLKRVKFVFDHGIEEYKLIVDTFFKTFENELSLYACLPCEIIGKLVFDSNKSLVGDNSSEPILTWYVLPLDKESNTYVDISYSNSVSFDDDTIVAKQIENKKIFRSDNKEFISLFIESGVCYDVTSTPVTDLVYNWLKHDLKRIGWID